MSVVVMTDYPWADDALERELLGAAGHELISGPSAVSPAVEIEALVARTSPAAILTCWAQLTGAAISSAGPLKIVARLGVGLDNIDVAAATRIGAVVTNVPDYCFEEVSDHAIALLLALSRGLAEADRRVKGGDWTQSGVSLRRFRDTTVGLFGYGRIGRRIAAKLSGFGVRLLAHTRSGDTDGVAEAVSLDRLLALSDAILVVAPLNDASHHLFDADRLSAMKAGSFLVNVSRGAIIENVALIDALERGQLAGAGLDVIEGEPDPPRALVDRTDVIATPHMAYSSVTATEELRRRACAEVIRVLAGEAPQFPCNEPARVVAP